MISQDISWSYKGFFLRVLMGERVINPCFCNTSNKVLRLCPGCGTCFSQQARSHKPNKPGRQMRATIPVDLCGWAQKMDGKRCFANGLTARPSEVVDHLMIFQLWMIKILHPVERVNLSWLAVIFHSPNLQFSRFGPSTLPTFPPFPPTRNAGSRCGNWINIYQCHFQGTTTLRIVSRKLTKETSQASVVSSWARVSWLGSQKATKTV